MLTDLLSSTCAGSVVEGDKGEVELIPFCPCITGKMITSLIVVY